MVMGLTVVVEDAEGIGLLYVGRGPHNLLSKGYPRLRRGYPF